MVDHGWYLNLKFNHASDYRIISWYTVVKRVFVYWILYAQIMLIKYRKNLLFYFREESNESWYNIVSNRYRINDNWFILFFKFLYLIVIIKRNLSAVNGCYVYKKIKLWRKIRRWGNYQLVNDIKLQLDGKLYYIVDYDQLMVTLQSFPIFMVR